MQTSLVDKGTLGMEETNFFVRNEDRICDEISGSKLDYRSWSYET